MTDQTRAKQLFKCLEASARNARQIAVACREANYPAETIVRCQYNAKVLFHAADLALKIAIILEEVRS